MSNKELQLVLYGATGFTGRLAVQYLAKQYSGSIRWAIAGRSKAKLQELASSCHPAPVVIVADGDDQAALLQMTARTAAVATCAGPFARYGSKLVAACVANGTHYCDITGEIDWVREMIAQHDDAALASGARIVHLCGHDSVPWDLTALMLSKKLRENDEELVQVDMYNDIRSRPSGGTLETAMGMLLGKKPENTASRSLGFDPLLKQKGTAGPSPFTVSARNVQAVEWASPSRSFFMMSGVNANAVKRSNAINGYGRRVTYCEGQVASNIFVAVCNFLVMVLFGLLLFLPPTRWLMFKCCLPSPGEGPSAEFMESGYLTVEGRATGSKGSKVRSTMRFVVDPGYKDTARMVVEAALALSLEGDKITVPGGVYTPAACQGEVFLKRLLSTGTAFEINELRPLE